MASALSFVVITIVILITMISGKPDDGASQSLLHRILNCDWSPTGREKEPVDTEQVEGIRPSSLGEHVANNGRYAGPRVKKTLEDAFKQPEVPPAAARPAEEQRPLAKTRVKNNPQSVIRRQPAPGNFELCESQLCGIREKAFDKETMLLPWAAAIRNIMDKWETENLRYGTMIGPYLVITIADDDMLKQKNWPQNIRVYLGNIDVSNINSNIPNWRVNAIETVQTANTNADGISKVALLILENNNKYRKYLDDWGPLGVITPICFPEENFGEDRTDDTHQLQVTVLQKDGKRREIYQLKATHHALKTAPKDDLKPMMLPGVLDDNDKILKGAAVTLLEPIGTDPKTHQKVVLLGIQDGFFRPRPQEEPKNHKQSSDDEHGPEDKQPSQELGFTYVNTKAIRDWLITNAYGKTICVRIKPTKENEEKFVAAANQDSSDNDADDDAAGDE